MPSVRQPGRFFLWRLRTLSLLNLTSRSQEKPDSSVSGLYIRRKLPVSDKQFIVCGSWSLRPGALVNALLVKAVVYLTLSRVENIRK